MQNHEGPILHAQKPVQRQTITVSLPIETIKRLDAISKNCERSRSNLISLILNSVLLVLRACDASEP